MALNMVAGMCNFSSTVIYRQRQFPALRCAPSRCGVFRTEIELMGIQQNDSIRGPLTGARARPRRHSSSVWPLAKPAQCAAGRISIVPSALQPDEKQSTELTSQRQLMRELVSKWNVDGGESKMNAARLGLTECGSAVSPQSHSRER